MPQARTVVLNYNPADPSTPFGPNPRRVPAGPNDTIRFRLSPETRTSHPNCKLRITFHSGQRVSQPVLEHGPGQAGSEDLTVTVLAGAPAANSVITAYKCELLNANGQPIPGLALDGADGGEVVPDIG